VDISGEGHPQGKGRSFEPCFLDCACFVPEPAEHTTSILEEKVSGLRSDFLAMFRSDPLWT
jgi:hypothetical protein